MRPHYDVLKRREASGTSTVTVETTDADETEEQSGPQIVCRSCENVLTEAEMRCSVGTQGPVETFVNPGGYVHEVHLFRSVRGALSLGQATRADSWFPGYSWRFAICRRCDGFLGWAYEANQPGRPPHFWGLRSEAIRER